MRILRLFSLLFVLMVFIMGCATPLQMSIQGNETLFRNYTSATVGTFEDISEPVGNTDEQRQAYKDTLKVVCKTFTEYLTQEIQRSGIYPTVVKDPQSPSESTLIISGFVHKYDKGNAALRFLIGFGAGSSLFHATIHFKDGKSGKILGTISNNGSSWIGGGSIASSQNVDVLMRDAATHVALELLRVRQN